jgi:site-specific recombinase XerD
MSRLLNQIKQEIRRRNYSYRTEKSYIQWIKRFVKFCDFKHPLEIEQNQVTTFLNFLANDCNVAASTQNQALCAIVFLYKEVLNHPLGELENLKYAKRYKHIPVVLSETEVKALLDLMNGVKKLIVSLI